jgi:hypothetical protein
VGLLLLALAVLFWVRCTKSPTIGTEIRLLGLPGHSYEVCWTMPAYIEFWRLAVWASSSTPAELAIMSPESAKLTVASMEQTGRCAYIPSGTKVRILDNDVSVEVGNGQHIASNQDRGARWPVEFQARLHHQLRDQLDRN